MRVLRRSGRSAVDPALFARLAVGDMAVATADQGRAPAHQAQVNNELPGGRSWHASRW
jgi:hypothetical protein